MNRKLLFNQNNHHNKKGLYNQLFSGICTEAQKKKILNLIALPLEIALYYGIIF